MHKPTVRNFLDCTVLYYNPTDQSRLQQKQTFFLLSGNFTTIFPSNFTDLKKIGKAAGTQIFSQICTWVNAM